MAGEGIMEPGLVHLVKTHWPERPGWRAFEAHRAILLVRNPFDAIESYFNMTLTNTHHLTLKEEVYERFQDTFKVCACVCLRVPVCVLPACAFTQYKAQLQ